MKNNFQKQEWLNLLHMKKKWSGFESAVHGDHFFLSPQGATQPEAELLQTVESLFGTETSFEPQKSAIEQCRFLARRDFLLRHGPEFWKLRVQKCTFSQNWLAKLNAQKMSVIFASGYMNSAASSFGHTFLKLQNPANQNGQELLDYGINFSAQSENKTGALYALYGLFGYFPGVFSMAPYHQMIKDYTNLEGRDLWEYELNFSPEEVQRLIYHLLELENTYFDYYFLSDNCSFEILKVLEIGRPGLSLAKQDELYVIPLDTVKHLKNIVSKVHYRASLETEWQQRKEALSVSQREELKKYLTDPQPINLKSLDSETLLTAQIRTSLLSFEKHNPWKEQNYQVSLELSQRGPHQDAFKLQNLQESPDKSPNSAAISLGYLQNQEHYLLVSGHLAFHDQLSRNEGVSPFSQLKILEFEILNSSATNSFLKSYQLLETLSTAEVDAFAKPLSWGIAIGGDDGLKNDLNLQNYIKSKFGYSLDFFKHQWRWTNRLAVAAQQDLDLNWQLTPGLSTQIWMLWTPGIRSVLSCDRFYFANYESTEFAAHLVADLSSQLELRFRWQMKTEKNSSRNESLVQLVQNF